MVFVFNLRGSMKAYNSISLINYTHWSHRYIQENYCPMDTKFLIFYYLN